MDNTLKLYAKKAKERLKNGFWERAKEEVAKEKQVAATNGISTQVAMAEEKRKLTQQIYNYDGFCAEEEFYNKVVEIIESDELVINPIMRLADSKYMESLSPAEKQSYISKVATHYREAVERYNKLHG